MFDLGTDWWAIVIRTLAAYLALLVGLRLTGRRQLGQMTPFDFVVILLIANALQNAMIGPDTSLLGGLIAAAVLLVANYVASRVLHGVPLFGRIVEGQPAVLIADGELISANIRHEGVDLAELEQAVREHGVEGLDDVKMAVLEVDGTISVVPKSAQTVRTKRRFRTRKIPAS
ncbi:MAG TPA: YetF domain-containing protein [Tepidiformaceae bacterium]|nr:YetF domain-containing protein [Tepidiformaceae bacterium]HSE46297.1 YetF domain-containing protein [Gemmatimonadales bacterium]